MRRQPSWRTSRICSAERWISPGDKVAEALYRIATCKPSDTLVNADRLREAAGSPEAVIAPWFRVQVRVGRHRLREIKQQPVLSGVLFVAEEAIDSAKGPGGICPCRSRAGGIVQMLTPGKDPVTGDRDYARVYSRELSPLIEYAEAQDRVFDVERCPVDPQITAALIGKGVVLADGLLSSSTGVVTRANGNRVTIAVDAGGFVSSVTVPASFVRVIEE